MSSNLAKPTPSKTLAARIVLASAVVFGCGAVFETLPMVNGQPVEGQPVEGEKLAEAASEIDGPIVPINPINDQTGNEQVPDANAAEGQAAPAKRAFWIGIQGRTVASPVLRTHLQLADDLGVVIEQIVPDSPAAQAGLRQHDVIIAAGGEPLQDMRGLQKLVLAGEGKPIELKILRLAKEKTITVTPTERPADLQMAEAAQNPFGLEGDAAALMREMLQGRGGFPQMQMFNQRGDWQAALPGGIAIQMQRQNGEPPRITVKRGDETWEIVGGDAQSLEKLPEDLRGPVEKLLRGDNLAQFGNRPFGGGIFGDRLPGERGVLGGGLDIEEELNKILPERRPRQRLQNGGLPHREPRNANPERDALEKQMLERMRELEERLEAMQQRMEEAQ